ncbi:hypothetical protein BT69DRAFT_271976, partial [Atractiella rhizophila]
NKIQPHPRSHPKRPPLPSFNKPFYERLIPSLSTLETQVSLSLRVFPLHEEGAIATLQKWLNDPRVDEFWGDWREDEEARRTWLLERFEGGGGRTIPSLGEWKVGGVVPDGEQEGKKDVKDRMTTQGWFSYFEIYWAFEDKLAHHLSLPPSHLPISYTPHPYDRGLHFLVGSSLSSQRGPHRVKAWLTSLCHYVFMADSRTERVVCDPDHRNVKMIRYLEDVGFESKGLLRMGEGEEAKVANVVVLEREKFWRVAQF